MPEYIIDAIIGLSVVYKALDNLGAFTPTFQATIPDVLPEEKDYTKALSLSRLAYDMESLASPMLAAALLGIMNFHWLFSGTAVGFAASALLVLSVTLPRTVAKPQPGGIYDKTTRGTRQYLKTPRLRGLLAVTLAAAAASAMVIVNTPVLVRGVLGLGQSEVAITLAAFGGGSMIAALLLPRLLDRIADRSIMIAAAAFMTAILALLTVAWAVTDPSRHWPIILLGRFALGLSYAASITPGGRLLRRSSGAEDRPALFAAQFALSHVCWLVAYPLAGQVGARAGMDAALGASAVLALIGTLLAFRIWPRGDPDVLAHHHDNLPPDHPHLAEGHAEGEAKHAYVIDELHPEWPGR